MFSLSYISISIRFSQYVQLHDGQKLFCYQVIDRFIYMSYHNKQSYARFINTQWALVDCRSCQMQLHFSPNMTESHNVINIHVNTQTPNFPKCQIHMSSHIDFQWLQNVCSMSIQFTNYSLTQKNPWIHTLYTQIIFDSCQKSNMADQ